MFWGLTPAIDFVYEYKKENTNLPNKLGILIIGGVDARHILQTISKLYRHNGKIEIDFYIIESCTENVAKQLLLLNIALQSSKTLGSVYKTKLFMELYGNTLVRPSVAKHLKATATELIKMITNDAYLLDKMPAISLQLKYQERDYLENLLKFWSGLDEFNICDIWDRRLRKTLGARYDSKSGVFDWDLYMRFHQIGGAQVCNQEYKNFRSTGVAFNWLESEVSKPNRSFVVGVIPNGERFLHYGYLGDMQTGPFVSYGLECDDDKFLKSVNGQNAYRATDVTERNLLQIFHEIEFGTEYVHRPISDLQLGPIVMQLSDKPVIDGSDNEIGSKLKEIEKSLDIDGIKINFLSLSLLNLMKHRKQYGKFFDLIYFGHNYLQYLNADLIRNVAKENCLLFVENQRYILAKRDEHLRDFETALIDAVNGLELKKIPFDPLKDDFAKFIVMS